MASASVSDGPPRVLHVISGLEVGGAEMALQRLVLRMGAGGHPVMVAAMLGGGRVEDALLEAGIPVASLRRRLPSSGGVPNGLLPLVSTSRSFRPQVIMGWMYHGIALAHIVRRLGRIPAPISWNIRCTLDDSETLPVSTRILIRGLRRASRHASAIVYNSGLGREQHAGFGFSDACGAVVPNGVDTEEYRPDPVARARIRQEFGIPEESFVVGHVARFHRMKGQLDLLEAMAVARLPAGATLMMVGREVSAGNPHIAAALGRLPPGLRVVMPGERRDIAAIMNAFDVYCLSSTTEGFPNVVAEAMACGVPCVVTDVGDAPLMVEGAGIVVRRSAPRALGDAVQSMGARSEAERRVLGEAARRRAVDRYSIDRMVQDYVGLFSRLVLA